MLLHNAILNNYYLITSVYYLELYSNNYDINTRNQIKNFDIYLNKLLNIKMCIQTVQLY